METDRLIETGLTKNQAEVYLELIKNPGQTGGEIAKNLSIDRSFSYGILNSLLEKGLVNYIIKKDKRLFSPSDPENLLKEIEEKRDKIISAIKEIKSIKRTTQEEKSVKVYEGKSGLKIYVRELIESKEFHTFGGGGKLNILEELKYEYPHYLKEIQKKKMSGKLITSPENKKIMAKLYGKSNVKIKDVKNLKNQVNFTIFKNKLAIYSAEKKPFVILIKDKKISDTLKVHFENLWRSLK
jgi:sugar-specific transcriptional regulator TrmB